MRHPPRADDRSGDFASVGLTRSSREGSGRRPARRNLPQGALHQHVDAFYALGAGFLFGVALFIPSLCGLTHWTPVWF